MKKIASLILCFLITGMYSIGFAAAKSVSPQVYSGISKYKKANYTGCIQDMQAALKKNPNDILAKYYMALVYTKIGLKEEAKEYYQKVVNQGSEKVLVTYSKKALICLDSPDNEICGKKDTGEDDDMSLFIKSGQFLHPEIQKKIQDRELKDIKNSFNSDKMPDLEDYRFINDASSELEPTDGQIAAAVKILAKVGYNPAAQMYNGYSNPQMQALNMLNMQGTNNNYANFMPYIMAQNNNTSNSNISPELIQNLLMNQSMGAFGFDSKN